MHQELRGGNDPVPGSYAPFLKIFFFKPRRKLQNRKYSFMFFGFFVIIVDGESSMLLKELQDFIVESWYYVNWNSTEFQEIGNILLYDLTLQLIGFVLFDF